jgi:DNA polymerase III epsilon subunit-like protein
MPDIWENLAAAKITFVVIDFEGTTPKGHRPEPIEVAALAMKVRDRRLTETARFQALIQPPTHAPITPFDSGQTGITPAMVAGQPPAADVLARLDARMTEPPYLLVAHHAATEAGFLADYQQACPVLAGTDLLDTIKLAKAAYPGLPSYSLDPLLAHLQIPTRPGRHRAMPDVELTAELFTRLINHGPASGSWSTISQLRACALRRAKANQPAQVSLFS